MIIYLGERQDNIVNLSESMGKKAYHLHQLKKQNFNVPAGFVLNHDSFIELEKINWQAVIDKIGGFPVAVRSSGQMEDLTNASFAGLYESFLNVNSVEELKLKIKMCFDSALHPRVEDYLKKNNIKKSPDELIKSVSVLVQKMVQPDFAGVSFAVHPISGHDHHILIEVCQGLGEKLVSGHVNPSQYVFDFMNSKIVEKNIGDEGVQLDGEIIEKICAEVVRVSIFYKSPQDVEWAYGELSDGEEKSLWILQSRPITKLSWRTDLGEMTNADLKDGGISARVCTPLMFSLYEKVMNHMMPEYLHKVGLISLKERMQKEGWIYYSYGRAYWNAGKAKNALKVVPGFNEETFDKDLGIQKDYSAKGNNKPHITTFSLKNIIKAIPILIKLKKEYKDCELAIKTFKLNSDKKNIEWLQVINNLKNKNSLKADVYDLQRLLERLYQQIYLPTELLYHRTIYNNSNYQTDFKSLLKNISKKYKLDIDYISLISGLNNISHMEVQKGIFDLYLIAKKDGFNSLQYEKAQKDFIKIHYHHGHAELDLKEPRWGEQPEQITKMIQSMIKANLTPSDPHESFLFQQKIYQQELMKIKQGILSSRKLLKNKIYRKFLRKLNKSREFFSLREAMRAESTKSFFLLRAVIIELGAEMEKLKLIDDKEDIFYFKINELISGEIGGDELKEVIKNRKRYYQMYSEFNAPNEFGPNLLVSQNSPQFVTSGDHQQHQTMKGIPCSSGCYQGKAKVIYSISDIHLIEKGDVLVTKFTDPGWTPVLGLVSAIVTEVGGVLSHAAVIGREYGIPAVLNIPKVTQMIKTGQTVIVDGSQGLVTIVKD